MSKGFTLLEVILAIATIAILTGISAVVYSGFQTKNDLDIALNTVAQNLRRAQVLSEAVDGDTSWGVKVQTGSITLFKGISFIARDTNFDEMFDLQSSVIPYGSQEIVFNKFSGIPQTTGTLTLSTSNGDSKTLTINSKGTVNY